MTDLATLLEAAVQLMAKEDPRFEEFIGSAYRRRYEIQLMCTRIELFEDEWKNSRFQEKAEAIANFTMQIDELEEAIRRLKKELTGIDKNGG